MKIITPGNLPEEKIYKTTCSNCKCVFEFAKKEGSIHSDQREGSWIEISCPFCGKTCIVTIGDAGLYGYR